MLLFFYYILYCYPLNESISPKQRNVFLLTPKHTIFKINPNQSTQTIPANHSHQLFLNPPQISLLFSFRTKTRTVTRPINRTGPVYLSLTLQKKSPNGSTKSKSIQEVNYYPHLDGDISDVTFFGISFGKPENILALPHQRTDWGGFPNVSPTLSSTSHDVTGTQHT